jgi:hypothetical protein
MVSHTKGRLRVFQNRVLRRKFILKREEVKEVERNCLMRNFVIPMHQILQRR